MEVLVSMDALKGMDGRNKILRELEPMQEKTRIIPAFGEDLKGRRSVSPLRILHFKKKMHLIASKELYFDHQTIRLLVSQLIVCKHRF